jgi:hypothetical protein
MTGPAVDLKNGIKTVTLAWEDARQVWKDPVSQSFEADTWEPLENHVRAVLQAMDRLTPILAKALRDCS